MTTSTIKEFLVSLGFDIDEGGLQKFSSAIAAATGIALALGAAVTATAGVVVAGVKNIAEEYDALDKLAQRFHTTAEAVDEFQDIGQVLGLTKEQSIGSLTALDRAVNDTALGLGRAKKVFEEIGLAVLDSAGKVKPTTQVFDELAAKMQGMERGKQIRVMERLGLDPALLKMFSADLVGLKADLDTIDKATGFDLGDAVAGSKTFMKAWRAMKQEWQKVTIVVGKLYESIAVKLMPALSEAVNHVRRRLESARKYVMENLEPIRKVLDTVVGFLVGTFRNAFQLASAAMEVLGTLIKPVVDGLKTLTPGMLETAAAALGLYAAWLLLNAGILASPIFWILALGVALLGLYDDFSVWKHGGKSLIDWGAWTDEIAFVQGAIKGFSDFLTNAFTLVFAAVDGLSKLLHGDFAGAWRAVGESVDAVLGIFKTAYDWITKLVDIAGKWGGLGSNITGRIGSGLANAAQATIGSGMTDLSGNPVPASMAGVGQGGTTVSNSQTVSVQVQGSADPGATGRAVASESQRTWSDMTRNGKGSAR